MGSWKSLSKDIGSFVLVLGAIFMVGIGFLIGFVVYGNNSSSPQELSANGRTRGGGRTR